MSRKPPFIFIFFTLFIAKAAFSQNEPFAKRTVISGLNSPWEVTYGPNDSIWITENYSYLVKRIRVSNGGSTTLLNLSSLKNFSLNDGGRWTQGGLMGLAIHPNLYSSSLATRSAKPWVYLAYVYERITGQVCSTDPNSSNPCNFRTRIVRYEYQGNTLSNPVTILDNMPGSNDHNSGRLTIGPDLKLYYTIGDMGAGQFNNSSRTNNALATDVMEGKVLRLNSESDGDAGLDAWVPDDNPFFNGTPITPRDYVFTLGHRNAQGIVWGNVNGADRLYSSEHGDRSDDEVNMLVAGSNYGWNEVSGYCDNNYNGLTLGGNSGVDEGNFCSTTPTNQQPIKTLFTINQAAINALSGNNLTWPTVAPSSIEYYGDNSIPGWQNSLLVSCLKAGKIFRLKLNASGNGISNYGSGVDTASYFRGEGRFRDIALSPDGLKIYVACDASGQTSGPTGGFNGGGTPPPNAGAILEFTYIGIILPVVEPNLLHPAAISKMITMYPNPADESLVISIKGATQKPYTVQLYSATGLFIREMKTSKSEFTFQLGGLQSGMYFLQVRNAYDRLLKTQKVIKL